jgi:uncharacterized protein
MGEALRYVLFYKSGDLSLAAEHFPPHKDRYAEFMQRGVLLSLGPFSDRSGSLAVFTTREAAEEFAAGDPFVLHGVVSRWQIREWHEVTSLSGSQPRRRRPLGVWRKPADSRARVSGES